MNSSRATIVEGVFHEGMILPKLTSIFGSSRPLPWNIENGSRVGASLGQKALLYSLFTMMVVGVGGIRSYSIPFGED